VKLLETVRATRNTFRKTACTVEAEGLRPEVGGGTAMGETPDIQVDIQAAEEPEAGRHGGWEHQEACFVTDEDGGLPHRIGPLLCTGGVQSGRTREHLFMECPRGGGRRRQQKSLWAEVLKETRRGKSW